MDLNEKALADEGKLIDAIKAYRARTGLGLYESKKAVDAYCEAKRAAAHEQEHARLAAIAAGGSLETRLNLCTYRIILTVEKCRDDVGEFYYAGAQLAIDGMALICGAGCAVTSPEAAGAAVEDAITRIPVKKG